MPELERIIEEKLINQLVYGESQWTYRDDLRQRKTCGRILNIFWSRIIKIVSMENFCRIQSLNR